MGKRKLAEATKEAPLSKKEKKRRKKLAKQEAQKEQKKEDEPKPESPKAEPKDQPSTPVPDKKEKSAPDSKAKKGKKDKQWIKKKKGVEIRNMKVGEGQAAKWNDTITVKYVGTLEDKTVFDQDLKKGLEFTIGKDVVQGFSIGMVGLKVGGKRRIKVPAAAGYG